ncbi:MAG: hypothetical protein H0X62_05775 [Bacteroidetes bacterium]|nr:hypothetical protein [Bacteroidota bacterium]
MSIQNYIPYSLVIPSDSVRSDLFLLIEPFLDNLAYNDSMFLGDENSGYYEVDLTVVEEFIIDLPFLGGLQLFVGGGNVFIQVDIYYFPVIVIEEPSEDRSKFEAYLIVDVAKLRFPHNWLKPVITDSNGNLIEDPNENNYIEITIPFGFSINEKLQFTPLWPGGEVLPLSLPPAMIANTGFIFQINNLYFDFSKVSNIPQADADDRAADFTGFYAESATVILPPSFKIDSSQTTTASIQATDILVGTGGFSGIIALAATNSGDLLHYKLGEFKIALNAFDVVLKKGGIIGSNILGTLIIPGFESSPGVPAKIDILVHIGQNGEFAVTASEANTINVLQSSTFNINIVSISVGRKSGRFYLSVSGSLIIKAQGNVLTQNLPSIDFQKMIIWDNGEIELEGGGFVLPKAITFKLGPVAISVTAIGFGSHEQMNGGILRKYKFFEFSGGISLSPGGIDARGDGIKYYYTSDGLSAHRYIRISGIGIDLIIPGSATADTAALLISGYLSIKNPEGNDPAAGTEYAGGIDFKLPKLKMSGSAAMRMNPNVPAFIVDLGIEMASPVLLGATGLGIYGFRALAGKNYVARKGAANIPEEEQWEIKKAA